MGLEAELDFVSIKRFAIIVAFPHKTILRTSPICLYIYVSFFSRLKLVFAQRVRASIELYLFSVPSLTANRNPMKYPSFPLTCFHSPYLNTTTTTTTTTMTTTTMSMTTMTTTTTTTTTLMSVTASFFSHPFFSIIPAEDIHDRYLSKS